MTTAVDADILFDQLIPRAEDREASEALLNQWAERGPLVLSEAAYAEVAARFADHDALDRFLSDTGVRLSPSVSTTLYLAGVRWREYTRRRPAGLQCSRCGTVNRAACESCGEPLTARQHVVADFLIGAHALGHAHRLLTRDRGFYAAYFPELALA